MKKYVVNCKETSFGFVKVEANSVAEAREKADSAIMDGAVHWANMETEIGEIKECK